MSKPREYYYGDVKKWIMMRDRLPADREQVGRFQRAVDEAIIETKQMPNGEDRMKAINMILIKKTHTNDGASLDLFYSVRTIQYWINEFVNLVGKKAGY